MKKTISLFLNLCFCALMIAQGYRNPVIQGFHPDPSVVRVGQWFYLVNSSFQYFPGVPVYRSADLVNWQLIGNVLDRPSQLSLKGASSWLGIYAPTIRYHEGTYYVITTNVGNGGNFMVTATQPEGPWSEPIWLKQQGIDPSLFFDNGKCYMVSNPDNTITLCEIDPKTGQQLSPGKAIWRGTGGRYPEGPHLYKKDGYYYLLISEGGTELAHGLTMARSKQIEGPYEANPDNPVLTNCCMDGQDKQIQGTGHGDLVQAADGSWWMVLLAYRNFGGSYHHLGRETCLVPVEWQEGQWPVVNGGRAVDTLMTVPTLPLQPVKNTAHSTAKGFSQLGPEWVYLQNPHADSYKIIDGKLRLFASVDGLDANRQPTFVGRRQESAAMQLTIEMDVSRLQPGDEAGISVYQIANGHYDLFARRVRGGRYQVYLRYRVKSLMQEKLLKTTTVRRIVLSVSSDGLNYRFAPGQMEQCKAVETLETSLLSTEVVGGFTGITVGMFATGTGYADFLRFDYR